MKFKELIGEAKELKGSDYDYVVRQIRVTNISTIKDLDKHLNKNYKQFYISTDNDLEWMFRKIMAKVHLI